MKKLLLFFLASILLLFSCSIDFTEISSDTESTVINDELSRASGTVLVYPRPLGSGMCDIDYTLTMRGDTMLYSSLTFTWSDGYTQYDSMTISSLTKAYGSIQRRGMIPGRYRISFSGYVICRNTSYPVSTIYSQYFTVK